MISIDEAQSMLDDIAQELPPAFFQRLNGGIYLLPGERINPAARQRDLLILGEYHAGGPMGRFINIYYGSLMSAYSWMDAAQMKEKLREVLLHEFTHHLESMAGERGLEIKDREQIERYLRADQ